MVGQRGLRTSNAEKANVKNFSIIALIYATVSCSGTSQSTPTDTGGAPQTVGGSSAAIGGSAPIAGNSSMGGSSSTATGGKSNSGGMTTTGGAATGGSVNTGGSIAPGGTVATGGSKASGGSIAAGGSISTGGTKATGGASSIGGTTATGGSSAAGGTRNTGGASATGGSSAAGGSIATGGASATGGTRSTGGASATGGTRLTGGASATGGTKATGGASSGGSTHTGTWKIMPLGDSITATTCYPQLVYGDLRSAGHTNFAFIGSIVNNQSCGVSGLPSGGLLTEGHSGHLVVTDTNNGSVQSWLQANPPDIIMMHFATNDVWGNGGTTTANNVISAYTTILTQARAIKPNVIVFAAQIIPVNPAPCSASSPCNYEATVDSLIPAWASSHSTAASPVIAVNLEKLFNNGYFPNSSYTTDGVHPNLTGSQPMGTTMSAAMIAQVPSL